jgi:hypothetical protein
MAASLISSSPSSHSSADTRAWIVTVRAENGTEHNIEVVAEVSDLPPSANLRDVHESDGRSVVEAALTADPTRIPTRITCSAEGSQPEY